METVTRADSTTEKPLVSSGLGYVDACMQWVDKLHGSKIYILASGTLARKTSKVSDLEKMLGDKHVGTRAGMSPHTLMSEVLEVLAEMYRVKADCIVTLGGGSLSDAAKILSFAAANNVSTKEDLIKLPNMLDTEAPARPSKIPIILIPTTLSGGEYSAYAGVTDESTKVKYQFCGGLQAANVVILDGQVAVTTPTDVWIASGVRCIDHCCEALCSLLPRPAEWDVISDGCVKALQLMIPGLLETAKNPEDAEGRHRSQLGVAPSIVPLTHSIWPGASHGIGHIMGPMGVVHGKTSCVLMTAVHKHNARANAEYQAFVCEKLWGIKEAKALFVEKGLGEDKADLGDLLDAIVRALGMPRSLREVGITEDAQIEALAKNSLMDTGVTKENPVPMTTVEEVMQVLNQCR